MPDATPQQLGRAVVTALLEHQASQERGSLDSVLSTAATVGVGLALTTPLIDHVCAQIVEVLQLDRCRVDPGDGRALAVLDQDGTPIN